MAVPVFLCTGMMRSGSTWSFNVSRHIIQIAARKLNRPFGSEFLTAPQLENFLQKSAKQLTGLTVIKAHGVGPYALQLIREGQLRAVCTYRDPRDCVASMMTFLNDPFEQAPRRIRMNLEYITLFRKDGKSLFIRYEDMIADTRSHVRKIAKYLGVRLEEALYEKIDQRTDLESSKRICDEIKARPADQFRESGTHKVDPATSLHDNHIHSGRIGRWREEMTPEQIQIMNQEFAPWLIELGYESPATN